MKTLSVLLVVLLLSACAQQGRYRQAQDSMPKYLPENIQLINANPTHEPYYPPSLRPYQVLGKDYRPLTTAKGYEATGIASWYGEKFHGHLTANGERYNMYSMSAAHKTLPLPSFVRVTNLENKRQTIVRVNDRGPFHDDRIIDLSYAAALKLGFLATGVAKVKLEVMHVDQDGRLTVGRHQSANNGLFIQVAALQNQQKAEQLAQGLAQLYQIPSHLPNEQGIFKLRLGPIASEDEASQLLQELRKAGYLQAYALSVPWKV